MVTLFLRNAGTIIPFQNERWIERSWKYHALYGCADYTQPKSAFVEILVMFCFALTTLKIYLLFALYAEPSNLLQLACSMLHAEGYRTAQWLSYVSAEVRN